MRHFPPMALLLWLWHVLTHRHRWQLIVSFPVTIDYGKGQFATLYSCSCGKERAWLTSPQRAELMQAEWVRQTAIRNNIPIMSVTQEETAREAVTEGT